VLFLTWLNFRERPVPEIRKINYVLGVECWVEDWISRLEKTGVGRGPGS